MIAWFPPSPAHTSSSSGAAPVVPSASAVSASSSFSRAGTLRRLRVRPWDLPCQNESVPVRVQNAEGTGRDEPLPAPDPWIRQLAYLMDGAIPIGSWSFGLDPLIGLIPGIGDLIGALISMVIVVRAVGRCPAHRSRADGDQYRHRHARRLHPRVRRCPSTSRTSRT